MEAGLFIRVGRNKRIHGKVYLGGGFLKLQYIAKSYQVTPVHTGTTTA